MTVIKLSPAKLRTHVQASVNGAKDAGLEVSRVLVKTTADGCIIDVQSHTIVSEQDNDFDLWRERAESSAV